MVPLQGIYSEALSAMAYVMSNVVMNEYVQSVCKTLMDLAQLCVLSGCRVCDVDVT